MIFDQSSAFFLVVLPPVQAMKPLSRQRELQLIALAKAGDLQARSALLTQYHWMLWRFAVKTKTRTEMAEDLYQEAVIAFFRSIELFNPRKKVRLTTYLYSRIPYILKRIAGEDGVIRVPEKCQRLSQYADNAERASVVLSINEKLDITENTPGDDPLARERELLHAEIQRLPEKERIVIRERIAGKTLQEIGDRLGIAREWVRKIQLRATYNLKQRLAVA